MSVVGRGRAARSVAAEADPVIDLQAGAEIDDPAADPPLREVPASLQPQPVQHRRAPTWNRVYRVTAYADEGLTASGRPVGVGQCAAPINVPFGAKVHIPALGRTFVVTDRTHPRFRHNTVDVFLPSEPLCRQFGRRYLQCEITLPHPPPRR